MRYLIWIFICLFSCSAVFAAESPFPEKRLIIIDLWNYDNHVVGDDAVLSPLQKMGQDQIDFLSGLLHIPSDHIFLIQSRDKTDILNDIRIRSELTDLIEGLNNTTDVFIYYSGHGHYIYQDGQPVRCLLSEATTLGNDGEYNHYLTEHDFFDIINRTRSQNQQANILLFLDACYQTSKVTKSGDILWPESSSRAKQVKTWESAADMVFSAGSGKVVSDKSLFNLLYQKRNDLLRNNLTVSDLALLFPDRVEYKQRIADHILRTNQGYLSVKQPPGFNFFRIDGREVPGYFEGRLQAGSYLLEFEKFDFYSLKYQKKLTVLPEQNYHLRLADFEPVTASLAFVPNSADGGSPGSCIDVALGGESRLARYDNSTHSYMLTGLFPGNYGDIIYNNKKIKDNLVISSGQQLQIPFDLERAYSAPLEGLDLAEKFVPVEYNFNKLSGIRPDRFYFNDMFAMDGSKIIKFRGSRPLWQANVSSDILDLYQSDGKIFCVISGKLYIIDKTQGTIEHVLPIALLPYQTPVGNSNSIVAVANNGLLEITDEGKINAIFRGPGVRQVLGLGQQRYLIIRNRGLTDELISFDDRKKEILARASISGDVNYAYSDRGKIFLATTDGIGVRNIKLEKLSENHFFRDINFFRVPLLWNGSLNIFQNDQWFRINNENRLQAEAGPIPQVLCNSFAQVDNYVFYLRAYRDKTIIYMVDLARQNFSDKELHHLYTGMRKAGERLVLYNDHIAHLYNINKRNFR